VAEPQAGGGLEQSRLAGLAEGSALRRLQPFPGVPLIRAIRGGRNDNAAHSSIAGSNWALRVFHSIRKLRPGVPRTARQRKSRCMWRPISATRCADRSM
jgi:hypothetical protein